MFIWHSWAFEASDVFEWPELRYNNRSNAYLISGLFNIIWIITTTEELQIPHIKQAF